MEHIKIEQAVSFLIMTAFPFNSKQILFFELLFVPLWQTVIRSNTRFSKTLEKLGSNSPAAQEWSLQSVTLTMRLLAGSPWLPHPLGDLGAGYQPLQPHPGPFWSFPAAGQLDWFSNKGPASYFTSSLTPVTL